MGLCAHAKGLTDETGFDCGYLTYGRFLISLARTAYGDKMGDLYEKFRHGATQSDIDFWNAHCNYDLDILLFHSDCDGKFTP